MTPTDAGQDPAEGRDGPGIACADCRAALGSAGRASLAFLLVDELTVPVVGCPEHRERVRSVCSVTADRGATLLDHRPAGGVVCPSCRLATNRGDHPVLTVGEGAVAVLACETHREAVVDRYRAGLRAREGLTASLTTDAGPEGSP